MPIQLKGRPVVSVHHQLVPNLAVGVVVDQAGVHFLVVVVVWETKKTFLFSLSLSALKYTWHSHPGHLLSVVSLQIQGSNVSSFLEIFWKIFFLEKKPFRHHVGHVGRGTKTWEKNQGNSYGVEHFANSENSVFAITSREYWFEFEIKNSLDSKVHFFNVSRFLAVF